MRRAITPTGRERKLEEESFIVSRTDPTGKITYANRVFMEISGYPERDLIGVQHNLIRHPDMPRGVFHFLWEELAAGREFLGFVKNLCSNGDHYWVFASVNPEYDPDKTTRGYYSVRRRPPDSAIAAIDPIYREMLRIEQGCSSKKQAPKESLNYLQELLSGKGVSYEQFVLDLYLA
ncbi:MAG: PAS domain S-box protein [Gammaproteobacteria bacterium]|nr:MAG: PAS domain S-box protein [Gammaproteobacteria bacterium]